MNSYVSVAGVQILKNTSVVLFFLSIYDVFQINLLLQFNGDSALYFEVASSRRSQYAEKKYFLLTSLIMVLQLPIMRWYQATGLVTNLLRRCVYWALFRRPYQINVSSKKVHRIWKVCQTEMNLWPLLFFIFTWLSPKTSSTLRRKDMRDVDSTLSLIWRCIATQLMTLNHRRT